MKSALLAQISAHLEQELVVVTRAAEVASAAATHAEAKPENKYDTRGLEASYLAGAQRERAAELTAQIQRLKSLSPRTFTAEDPIAAGALVELDLDGTRSLCFLTLVGAGVPLRHEGRAVLAITTQSPLGRALLGKRAGDLVTVQAGSGEKEYEILGVR